MATEQLPPWDEMRYWDVVSTSFQSVPAGHVAQLTTFSVERTALYIGCVLAATQYATVTTNSSPVSGEGLVLTANSPNIMFTYQEHGPLVWQAWFGLAANLQNFTTFEARLKAWPQLSMPQNSDTVQRKIDALASSINVMLGRQQSVQDQIDELVRTLGVVR